MHYLLSPMVKLAILGDEVVIMEISSGKYHACNTSAAVIIAALQSKKTLAQICELVATRFHQPRERVEEDTLRFITMLVTKAFCHVTD